MILSNEALRAYMENGGLKFDPALLSSQVQQNGVDLILHSVECGVLSAGGFTLGRTKEFVTMPNDLMAFVQLRSTWARCGFILPPTVIDAGFKGTITLEIAKFGAPAALPIGERFAHIIFARLTGPTAPYAGKYQGQVAITGAIL